MSKSDITTTTQQHCFSLEVPSLLPEDTPIDFSLSEITVSDTIELTGPTEKPEWFTRNYQQDPLTGGWNLVTSIGQPGDTPQVTAIPEVPISPAWVFLILGFVALGMVSFSKKYRGY